MALIDENEKRYATTGIVSTNIYKTEGEQTFPKQSWEKEYNKQETVNAWWKFTIIAVIVMCVSVASFELGKEMGVKGTKNVINSAAKHGNPIMFMDGTTFICNEIEKTTVVK